MGRDRELPSCYVNEHIELAYATTIHGAQGETVDHAHVAIGDTTDAAAAYVEHLVKSVNEGQLVVRDAFGRVRKVPDLVADGVEDVLQNLDPGEAFGNAGRGPSGSHP